MQPCLASHPLRHPPQGRVGRNGLVNHSFSKSPPSESVPLQASGVYLPSQPQPSSGRNPQTGPPRAVTLMKSLKPRVSSPIEHGCHFVLGDLNPCFGSSGPIDKVSIYPEAQVARP